MAGSELVTIDPRRYERDRVEVEAGFWRKLRRSLGLIPFAEDAVAAFFCARDPATPPRVKAVLMGALAYFILPADLIPDFIGALGFTDDAAVLAAALRSVLPHVKEHHRLRARTALAREDKEPPPA